MNETLVRSGYVFALADLNKDREAILDVWERNFPVHERAEHARRLRWYYEENPWGAGRCWLAIDPASGKVVGTAGLGLRRLRAGGVILRAGVASDLAVDKEHRSLHAALTLERHVLATLGTDLDLIYATPNARSVGIFRRLGYQEVGGLERWVKVLRVDRHLRGRPWLRPVAGLAAPLANLAWRIASRDAWPTPATLRLVPHSPSDPLWDDLAASTARGVPQGIRSTAFLCWRYEASPHPAYEFLAIDGPGSRQPEGYVAGFMTADGEWQVVDWRLASGPALTAPLVDAIVRHARNRGAASVSLTGLNAGLDERLLGRHGFRRRPWTLTVFASFREDCSATIEELRQWQFLLGDEDYN